jgi:hypothetical protein
MKLTIDHKTDALYLRLDDYRFIPIRPSVFNR